MGDLRCLWLAAAALLAAALVTAPMGALFSESQAVENNAFTTDTLNAPTGASAAAGGSAGRIDVSWTATADTYASGHRVLRATATGGPYTQVAEVTPRTTTSYQDTGLTSGTTYYYVVRAFYQSWESANSNEASALAP